ncbi:MAG: hypothetical protein ACKPKO_26675, partial [Candidatus Fonsibacter sp.]
FEDDSPKSAVKLLGHHAGVGHVNDRPQVLPVSKGKSTDMFPIDVRRFGWGNLQQKEANTVNSPGPKPKNKRDG